MLGKAEKLQLLQAAQRDSLLYMWLNSSDRLACRSHLPTLHVECDPNAPLSTVLEFRFWRSIKQKIAILGYAHRSQWRQARADLPSEQLTDSAMISIRVIPRWLPLRYPDIRPYQSMRSIVHPNSWSGNCGFTNLRTLRPDFGS